MNRLQGGSTATTTLSHHHNSQRCLPFRQAQTAHGLRSLRRTNSDSRGTVTRKVRPIRSFLPRTSDAGQKTSRAPAVRPRLQPLPGQIIRVFGGPPIHDPTRIRGRTWTSAPAPHAYSLRHGKRRSGQRRPLRTRLDAAVRRGHPAAASLRSRPSDDRSNGNYRVDCELLTPRTGSAGAPRPVRRATRTMPQPPTTTLDSSVLGVECAALLRQFGVSIHRIIPASLGRHYRRWWPIYDGADARTNPV